MVQINFGNEKETECDMMTVDKARTRGESERFLATAICLQDQLESCDNFRETGSVTVVRKNHIIE